MSDQGEKSSRTSPDKFGPVAVALHWIIAAAMVAVVAYGLIADTVSDPETTRSTLALHESIGVTIFALAVFRLVWRLTHASPPPPAGQPLGQRIAAAVTHWTLYLFMFAMPVTGYVALAARGRPITIFGLFDLPSVVSRSLRTAAQMQNIHDYSQYPLYALVALHVIAALYHQFMVKDGIMGRMWFSK